MSENKRRRDRDILHQAILERQVEDFSAANPKLAGIIRDTVTATLGLGDEPKIVRSKSGEQVWRWLRDRSDWLQDVAGLVAEELLSARAGLPPNWSELTDSMRSYLQDSDVSIESLPAGNAAADTAPIGLALSGDQKSLIVRQEISGQVTVKLRDGDVEMECSRDDLLAAILPGSTTAAESVPASSGRQEGSHAPAGLNQGEEDSVFSHLPVLPPQPLAPGHGREATPHGTHSRWAKLTSRMSPRSRDRREKSPGPCVPPTRPRSSAAPSRRPRVRSTAFLLIVLVVATGALAGTISYVRSLREVATRDHEKSHRPLEVPPSKGVQQLIKPGDKLGDGAHPWTLFGAAYAEVARPGSPPSVSKNPGPAPAEVVRSHRPGSMPSRSGSVTVATIPTVGHYAISTPDGREVASGTGEQPKSFSLEAAEFGGTAYVIRFDLVNGYVTPKPEHFKVENGEKLTITGFYALEVRDKWSRTISVEVVPPDGRFHLLDSARNQEITRPVTGSQDFTMPCGFYRVEFLPIPGGYDVPKAEEVLAGCNSELPVIVRGHYARGLAGAGAPTGAIPSVEYLSSESEAMLLPDGKGRLVVTTSPAGATFRVLHPDGKVAGVGRGLGSNLQPSDGATPIVLDAPKDLGASYQIVFDPLDRSVTPQPVRIHLASKDVLLVTAFYELAGNNSGSLYVKMNNPNGRFRVFQLNQGSPVSPILDREWSLTLPEGMYKVEFLPTATGPMAPPPVTVQVTAGHDQTAIGIYQEAVAKAGTIHVVTCDPRARYKLNYLNGQLVGEHSSSPTDVPGKPANHQFDVPASDGLGTGYMLEMLDSASLGTRGPHYFNVSTDFTILFYFCGDRPDSAYGSFQVETHSVHGSVRITDKSTGNHFSQLPRANRAAFSVPAGTYAVEFLDKGEPSRVLQAKTIEVIPGDRKTIHFKE
jgi:hypothetical protein